MGAIKLTKGAIAYLLRMLKRIWRRCVYSKPEHDRLELENDSKAIANVSAGLAAAERIRDEERRDWFEQQLLGRFDRVYNRDRSSDGDRMTPSGPVSRAKAIYFSATIDDVFDRTRSGTVEYVQMRPDIDDEFFDKVRDEYKRRKGINSETEIADITIIADILTYHSPSALAALFSRGP